MSVTQFTIENIIQSNAGINFNRTLDFQSTNNLCEPRKAIQYIMCMLQNVFDQLLPSNMNKKSIEQSGRMPTGLSRDASDDEYN